MNKLAFGAIVALSTLNSDTPRFAPIEGSSVEKLLRSEVRFAATEVTSASVDGQGIGEIRYGRDVIVVEFRQVTELALTDKYVTMKDGRPVVLDRTFGALAQTERVTECKWAVFGPGPQVKERTRASAFESKTVRFSWNEELERYAAKFADPDDDPSLLDDLAEDIDFRAFLPKSGSAVGDEWTVDGRAFASLLSFGGDLHFEVDGNAIDDNRGDVAFELGSNLSGEIRCVFEDVRVKNGQRLAVIVITGELVLSSQFTDPPMRAKGVLRPKGKLLWDLSANRIHAVHIEGGLELTAMMYQVIEVEGWPALTDAIHMRLEGSVSTDVTTKAQ